MKFGICTGLENLALLEAAGFDYIEPGIAWSLKPEMPAEDVMPTFRQALDASRLTAEVCNGLLPGDLKIVGEEIDEACLHKYLESGFARAQSVGAKIAVFGSGASRRIPDGFSRERAQEQLLSFLQICGDIAARYGIVVAIEPLNRAECNVIISVGEAVELALAVGHPKIRVLSDLYHVAQEGQSYDETGDANSLLAHVHVAGRENRRAPIAEDYDYLRPYFAVLQQNGYAGRISIEGHWENLAAQAESSLDVLRRAWEAA